MNPKNPKKEKKKKKKKKEKSETEHNLYPCHKKGGGEERHTSKGSTKIHRMHRLEENHRKRLEKKKLRTMIGSWRK